jgi:hypothetical protein
LSQESSPEIRRLALELVAQMPAIDPILIAWLRPLLRDRRVPADSHRAAAAALLRAAGTRGRTANRLLRDFAAGYGRQRVHAEQAQLREQFAFAPAFDRLCSQLAKTVPMRCRRCGKLRQAADMPRHLWRKHHRILVGGKARSIASWLDRWSARDGNQSDPETGLAELARQLLSHDFDSGPMREALHALAARRGEMVCPHCLALVALPEKRFPTPLRLQPLEVSPDRVTGEGVVVERVTKGIQSYIRATFPDRTRFEMAEPGDRWNQTAAIRWLVLPWIALAIVFSVLLPPALAIFGAALALSGAYVFRLLIRSRAAKHIPDPLIDAAWRSVVPRLVERGNPAAAQYRSQLALASRGRGSPRFRMTELQTSLETATDDWAALADLQVQDRYDEDGDGAPALADMIGDAIRRDRPLGQLDLLLAHSSWRTWPTGHRARLRALTAARAFDLGLGVWELDELSRAVPALADLLDTRDFDGLARLRLIWSLQAERPWERIGAAASVFELARYPATEHHFLDAPDLLLYQPLAGVGAEGQPAAVLLTGRGVIFRGALLSAPGSIEVHLRPEGRGYELHFGTARFRYADNPSHAAQVLNLWSQYLFGELLPKTDAELGKPDGVLLQRLLKSKTLQCPTCGGQMLGRRTQ